MSSRRYPERPLVGVGAIVLDRGRVLLIERGKEPQKGFWSLPGGLLETGETIEDGIRREVREETGLEVISLGLLTVFERIIRDAAGAVEYHYVLVDHVCRVQSGTLRAADDAARAAWFRLPELAALPMTEGALPVIERAFREQSAKRESTADDE